VVLWFHSARGRRALAPFAYVGRMAPTNYLAQGFVIAFVLFGVGRASRSPGARVRAR
jgi:uncharacterized membrane protein YeiB